MASLNKVQLIGNVTHDPELRRTDKGVPVTEVSLAINRPYTDRSGGRHDEVTFVNVTFQGSKAELLAGNLKKSTMLYVEARLYLNTWRDKETGQKYDRLMVAGEEFQFLTPRKESAGSGTDGEAS